MQLAPTAPPDADNPLRLIAQQRGSETHAQIPPEHQALWTLILALLAALLGRKESLIRRPWCYPALDPTRRMEIHTPEAAAHATAEEPRWLRRLRGWIGWILRCFPNRGARRTFAPLAPIIPQRPPRAPPRPKSTRTFPDPSPKPRLRRRRLTPLSRHSKRHPTIPNVSPVIPNEVRNPRFLPFFLRRERKQSATETQRHGETRQGRRRAGFGRKRRGVETRRVDVSLLPVSVVRLFLAS